MILTWAGNRSQVSSGKLVVDVRATRCDSIIKKKTIIIISSLRNFNFFRTNLDPSSLVISVSRALSIYFYHSLVRNSSRENVNDVESNRFDLLCPGTNPDRGFVIEMKDR